MKRNLSVGLFVSAVSVSLVAAGCSHPVQQGYVQQPGYYNNPVVVVPFGQPGYFPPARGYHYVRGSSGRYYNVPVGVNHYSPSYRTYSSYGSGGSSFGGSRSTGSFGGGRSSFGGSFRSSSRSSSFGSSSRSSSGRR